MTEQDVIVGGGGMVGLTLGIALAGAGLKVTVADPMPKGAVLDAEDSMAASIRARALASTRMFDALGIWAHLKADAQPINDILVTDAVLDAPASPFSLHFELEGDRCTAGTHRREPAYPRRTLRRCGDTAEPDIPLDLCARKPHATRQRD